MADTTPIRHWWPSCLLDEVMPEGRLRPEDWLKPDADGVSTFWWDETVSDPQAAGTVRPGEVVEFCWYESRGRVDIRIMADGSWHIDGDGRAANIPDIFTGEVKPDLPSARMDDATDFLIDGDWETAADSMDELARFYVDAERPVDEGDVVDVWMARWSNGHLFRVSADGRSLTPVENHHG